MVVVVLCRLVYRKGIDLLTAIVPGICARFPQVDFLIAGDGPKRTELEQMRERHQLHERVRLLGGVPSEAVRSVLIRGHVFLNTSLTEAFCMAIVEAASCGLYVVTTNVGGIPEVLPEHMMTLARPDAVHLEAQLADAIERLLAQSISTASFHDEIRTMYSWSDVTARTDAVYQSLFRTPLDADIDTPLVERLRRVWGCGQIAGKFLCIVMVWNHFFLQFLQFCSPRDSIEPAM